MTKNQDIERLRAIAALAVLIGHVPWLQWGFRWLFRVPIDPWTGVDLFFVISGFVVSSAFERDLLRAATPRSAVRAFYTKRAARILPTAYLCLALWWVGMAWLNGSGAWGPLTGAGTAAVIAPGVFFVSNYALALHGVTTPLIWYWSLCIEEHFYLIYPAFRLVAGTLRRRIITILVVILAVHAARFLTDDSLMLQTLSHNRFDQLALGVLVGVARQCWSPAVASVAARLRETGTPRRVAIAAMGLLLTMLGALPVTLMAGESPWGSRVGYVLAGISSTMVVALASCDADLLFGGRVPIGRWLSAIGARSYGIYMFHVPALWLVLEARFRLSAEALPIWWRVPDLTVYLIVLAGLVEANYRCLERPLIAWSHRRGAPNA